ncbi:MAG: class I SAM-dependent methyltransferase [Candidatus Bathyarchaeota archaeon]|nr:class I SAM-dependent methyltransferase [Candidatus Bathyarchaeum sp.]
MEKAAMKDKMYYFRKNHSRAEHRVQEVITCLKLNGHDPKSGLLLDLGCGPGYPHIYFLKKGIQAVGIEVVKTRIQTAKKNSPNGNFILADGCKLPFKEDCFDTVISNDVLEHLPYELAKPMFDEANRTMKADGVVYISVANKYQIQEPHTLIPFLTWFPRPCWEKIHKIVKKRPIGDTYYPYTTRMLKNLCKETKFCHKDFTWIYALYKISRIDYIGNRTVRRIAQTIKKLGFTRQAQIIAEKVSVIIFVCKKC